MSQGQGMNHLHNDSVRGVTEYHGGTGKETAMITVRRYDGSVPNGLGVPVRQVEDVRRGDVVPLRDLTREKGIQESDSKYLGISSRTGGDIFLRRGEISIDVRMPATVTVNAERVEINGGSLLILDQDNIGTHYSTAYELADYILKEAGL